MDQELLKIKEGKTLSSLETDERSFYVYM